MSTSVDAPVEDAEARFIAAMAHRLCAILHHYADHRAQLTAQMGDRKAELRAIAEGWEESDIQPRWMDGLKAAENDPIRAALRSAAREVGWELYAAGGIDYMHRAMHELDVLRGDSRILDLWWDRIGLSKSLSPGRGQWWA